MQTISFDPVEETTADGSPTLYRSDIDEHYHSVKGALAESLYVYVGLGWRLASIFFKPVRVFEVGFGTGLNAALTAQAALESQMPTIYTSVELYPLPKSITDSLLPQQLKENRKMYAAVNDAGWDEDIQINKFFTLRKIQGNLLSVDIPKNQNVVFFDAFAPEKQPEMWSEEVFQRIYSAMASKGVLTTYCAKGCVRRLLQQVGFTVERLEGPRNGKREVLRATK